GGCGDVTLNVFKLGCHEHERTHLLAVRLGRGVRADEPLRAGDTDVRLPHPAQEVHMLAAEPLILVMLLVDAVDQPFQERACNQEECELQQQVRSAATKWFVALCSCVDHCGPAYQHTGDDHGTDCQPSLE